jgi:hypothetical protein
MPKKNKNDKRATAAAKRAKFTAKRNLLESENAKNPEWRQIVKPKSIWEVRKNVSVRVFKDPQELWEAACEYFKWVDEHPEYEVKPMSRSLGDNMGATIEMVRVPKRQPYTMKEMCFFIGVSAGYIKNLRLDNYKEGNKAGWKDVIEAIEAIVYTQQFNGATSGFFNHNIIVRNLGLVEKVETEVVDNRKSVADLFPPVLKKAE